MNNDIEKRTKKLEKIKKPLKKFKNSEYELETRLEPYDRKKISIRDVEDFIEEDYLDESK